jgi:uncharacterized protein YjlB
MHISPDEVEKSVVNPATPHRNRHRKRGSVSGSRQPEDQHYYHDVVEAMKGAAEILIVGPDHAKLELIKHIHAHDHEVVKKVIGVNRGSPERRPTGRPCPQVFRGQGQDAVAIIIALKPHALTREQAERFYVPQGRYPSGSATAGKSPPPAAAC